MKFALIDNQKKEAAKGLMGICPICHQSVIAKCGGTRIDHWAHKSLAQCDIWWEHETEWHRNWKNKFPMEWQEVVAIDEMTGEKHIADIKTDKGLVIEFQHSYISPEERILREQFYKDMVWVVDGTRCEGDFKRFAKAFDNKDIYCNRISECNPPKICFLGCYQNYLPKQWQKSSVPVIFDFKGLTDKTDCYYDRIQESLWCLLPKCRPGLPMLIIFDRNEMVEMVKYGSFSSNIKNIINKMND